VYVNSACHPSGVDKWEPALFILQQTTTYHLLSGHFVFSWLIVDSKLFCVEIKRWKCVMSTKKVEYVSCEQRAKISVNFPWNLTYFKNSTVKLCFFCKLSWSLHISRSRFLFRVFLGRLLPLWPCGIRWNGASNILSVLFAWLCNLKALAIISEVGDVLSLKYSRLDTVQFSPSMTDGSSDQLRDKCAILKQQY